MSKIDLDADLYSAYKYGLHNKPAFFDDDNKRLADFIIPFIYSLDPISDLRIYYLKMIAYIYKIPQNELIKNRDHLLAKTSEIEKYANETQALLWKMLDVAINQNIEKSEAEELEDKINKSIYYKRLYWRGGEFTGYSATENEYINMDLLYGRAKVPVLTLCSAKDMIRIIFEALAKAVCLGPDKYGGFKAIGVCRQCGRLYTKSRISQIFCSERCNNIAKQIRFRNRQLKE